MKPASVGGRELDDVLEGGRNPTKASDRAGDLDFALALVVALHRDLADVRGASDLVVLRNASDVTDEVAHLLALTQNLSRVVAEHGDPDIDDGTAMYFREDSLGVGVALAQEVAARCLNSSIRRLDDSELYTLVALGIYGLLANHPIGHGSVRRQERLTIDESARFVGAFEGVFGGVEKLKRDGLIDQAQENGVINLMRQLELARQRESTPTQQIELLLAELLQIINGALEDVARFRDEFVRLGSDPDVASDIAGQLARAMADNAANLGQDDPLTDANVVARGAAVDRAIATEETKWIDKRREDIESGAARAVGASAALGVGALLKDPFVIVARAFVRGLQIVAETFYGLN